MIDILFSISRPEEVFTLEVFFFKDGVTTNWASSLNVDYILHRSKGYFLLGSLDNAQFLAPNMWRSEQMPDELQMFLLGGEGTTGRTEKRTNFTHRITLLFPESWILPAHLLYV